MQYDEIYKNKEYDKYLKNKLSNEKIIEIYKLNAEEILLLNKEVSIKLRNAQENLVNLQLEISKLKEESEFSDYDRYFFTNFEILKIYFDTLSDINISEKYFISSNFNELQDICLMNLGFLQKYSKTHREHIKKFFVKNNNHVDKNDILDNSIYYIKEYILNNKMELKILIEI